MLDMWDKLAIQYLNCVEEKLSKDITEIWLQSFNAITENI